MSPTNKYTPNNGRNFGEIIAEIDDIENLSCLDMFAREGDWQGINIYERCLSYEAWEIDKEYIPALKKNLPSATVHCRDSVEFTNNLAPVYKKFYPKFDIIQIDAPLNSFGSVGQYSEHFDVMANVPALAKDIWYAIFNVVKQPYDYRGNTKWQMRRMEFYNLADDGSKLNMAYVEEFYKSYFSQLGYDTEKYKAVVRETKNSVDYFYSVVMKLKRRPTGIKGDVTPIEVTEGLYGYTASPEIADLN
tara:strand:+ start:191 stop:931 length:741 start_codon:yes stop_codon:yes gene_type:complete